MYSRAAIALLMMLLTATTAWANVTVTYELKGKVGGYNAYNEIRRQDNTSLYCRFSQVSGTDTPYWNANDTQGVDDEYDITFTPDVRLSGWINGNNNGFQTDKQAVNMTVTSNSSYYIVSVTLKKYDGTVLVSTTNDNDKSCTVSMPATSESQCISQAVIELCQAHAITVPDNISLSGGTFVGNVNGKPNYLEGSVITLTLDDADKAFKTLSVSGATYSLAADKKSATVTLGSSDVTVTATLMALTGTSNGVTWRVSDEDGNGTYDRLTLSGSGTLSTSPWANDFASSITRVDVSSTDIAISGNPFSSLTSGDVVIVVPTPAYAVGYANAGFASKLRVVLGNYLFGVTDEGGTPAYKIANADDLRRLATAVEATGNYASTDKTFRQTANITLDSNDNFTPIGANGGSKSFCGTYDGGSHTISGLNVSIDYGYIGLFGAVKGASVRNVTLVSPTLTATKTGNYNVRLGAVIGTCDGGANNVVENCHVISPNVSSSSTSSQNYVGAIIGCIWDTNTTVTNCYYYGGNATAAYGYKQNGAPVTNVGRAHKVILGDGVTVSPAATAAENGFVYDSKSYYREGVTLTLASNPAEGYGPVYSANGTAFDGTTYTVNSNDGNDVTLSATFVPTPVSISYIDENGVGQSADALLLQGGGATSLSGWYYVSGTVNITGKVTLDGNVNIILRDGATLNIGTAGERISSNCISGGSYTLTIYGQSGQTGTLKAYNSASGYPAVHVRNYAQHGGNVIIDATNDNPLWLSGGNLTLSRGTLSVTAAGAYSAIKLDNGKSVNVSGGTLTATSEEGNAIQSAVNMSGGTLTATTTTDSYSYAIYGDITFTGGKLTANGVNRGNSGNVSLSWSSLYDSFTCNRYGGTVSIADGKTFYDETGASYTSSTPDLRTVLAGKTLRPWGPADWADNGDGSYTIGSATGWDIFCDALLDNDTYNRFSGKTVKLANDISVSRGAGSGSGQNLTANDHPFCGTFLGQGHTLTFNYGSAGTPSNEDYIAPFRYISDATISGLHVSGNIYTSHVHAGGIIGLTYGTSNVTDCHSSVNIVSSINGDGTHGGILAYTWMGSTTNIEGCLFDGSIQSASGYTTSHCGGFMGWRNNTVNVTNCLLTADLSTIGTTDSYTFVRQGGSVNNSYYTQVLGTKQGDQARTITAGEGVSVEHAGVATTYDVSGITAYKATDASGASDPFIAGLLYNNVIYAGWQDAVSLTLTNTPPTGYGFGGYTTYTTSPDGATLTWGGNNYTLTMPDADVTIGATFMEPVSVSYIDENGDEQTVVAIPLQDGGATTLVPGWYVVNSNITYNGTVTLGGDVNIILADGKTMTANGDSDGIDGNGTLTVYGQTLGTGILNATSPIYCAFTMTGGTVNANSNPYAIRGNVTVSGGTLNATGQIAIAGDVTVTGGTLNATAIEYTNTARFTRSDWGIVSNYAIFGNLALSGPATVTVNGPIFDDVTIADGLTFYDETGASYTSSTSDLKTVIVGKTLRPYNCSVPQTFSDDADNRAAIATANNLFYKNVTISGRKLWKDGDWNTLCLPFDVTISGSTLEGAEARTLTEASISGTTLNLTFSDPVAKLEAGVPYIIKWTKDDVNPTIDDPEFNDVTIDATDNSYDNGVSGDTQVRFIGTYKSTTFNDPNFTEDRSILFLGAENTLYYPQSGATIGAFRVYFKIGEDDVNNARQITAFNLNFGSDEQTGINAVANSSLLTLHSSLSGWYTLDGRKLSGKPTKSGIYINGGRKVVVK